MAGEVPLSNGPFIGVSPPLTVGIKLRQNGQLLEFVVPYVMKIDDNQPWQPIEIRLGTNTFFIEKPTLPMTRLEPAGRLGNETPDVFCSILRVTCIEPLNQFPAVADAWAIVQSLLTWIRIKARHYWLLHGTEGFGALYRGSEFVQDGNQIGLRNVQAYGRNLIVEPLNEELWLSIAAEINAKRHPPVSEALFCDAMISAVSGDETKAILELGIAAEVEVTQMLADVAMTLPDSPQKRKYVAKGEKDKFVPKLCDWPSKLGLQDATAFTMNGLYSGWLDIVRELYKMRNGVAHSGKFHGNRDVGAYIFSTNALFAYCRAQRKAAGASVYSYPSGIEPYHRLILFRDGIFSIETSKVTATVS